jgi:hypothetical protein
LFSPPIKLTITEILLEVVLNNKILTVTMRNVDISEQLELQKIQIYVNEVDPPWGGASSSRHNNFLFKNQQ